MCALCVNVATSGHMALRVRHDADCVCVFVYAELCAGGPSPQSHSDAESQRSNMEREDTRSAASTPSTPSVCSPTSTASSVPSTGKNVCASCGLEILDRYLLKVRGLVVVLFFSYYFSDIGITRAGASGGGSGQACCWGVCADAHE